MVESAVKFSVRRYQLRRQDIHLPTKFVRYTGNGQVEDVKAQAVNPAVLPEFSGSVVSYENLVGSEHMPAGEAV